MSNDGKPQKVRADGKNVTARDANNIEYFLYESTGGKRFYFHPESNRKITLTEFDAVLRCKYLKRTLKRTLAQMDEHQHNYTVQIIKHCTENKKLRVQREAEQEQVRISHLAIETLQVQKEAAQEQVRQSQLEIERLRETFRLEKKAATDRVRLLEQEVERLETPTKQQGGDESLAGDSVHPVSPSVFRKNHSPSDISD